MLGSMWAELDRARRPSEFGARREALQGLRPARKESVEYRPNLRRDGRSSLDPEPSSHLDGIDAELGPPPGLVPRPMKLAVVQSTERDCEFVAHLAAPLQF